jgi:hypothetical protein
MMQVTKIWWDGKKLMAEPIDPAAIYKEPEQPAQPAPVQEPWGYGRMSWGEKMFLPTLPSVRDGGWMALYTTPPAAQPAVPDFKSFKEWAAGEGYDVAYTHDGIKWVCLNPMTADLWRAWQAAHGIKEST